MQPLINQFTNNLSKPCSGCNGDGVYETWLKAKETGEKMKFVLQVEVSTENNEDDLFSIVSSDRSKWKVLGGGVKPEPKVVQQGVQTGGQFSRTTVQQTPQLQ